MQKTFSEIEAELGLPAGAVAQQAFNKIGKTLVLAGKRFLVLGSGHLSEIPKHNKNPAVAEADTARLLFDLLKDETRLLDGQPCTYAADGLVKPLTFLEYEQLAAAKLRGVATYSAASTAGKHVLSMLQHEHRHTHSLRPEDVAPVLFRNVPRAPCWARLPVDDTPLQEPPDALQEFLQRVKTPAQADSLVRWIGSVLDMRSDRSEYLYLRGDGNDGKSTLIGALHKALSPASQVVSTELLKNAHGGTALEGKRLVVFNEENSGKFANSAVLKRITGDDAHLINPKNAALRTALYQCKVIYLSNFEPSLHGLAADKRRIAYVEVNPYSGIDTTWKTRLEAQAGDILRYCLTQYRAWQLQNPKGGRLGDPAALEDLAAESTVSEAEDALERTVGFTGKEDDYVSVFETKAAVKSAAGNEWETRAAALRLLRKRVGGSYVKKIDGKSQRVYRGIRLLRDLDK